MYKINIATTVFLLIASHYVFNLSYHSKVYELLIFIQEKIGRIPSCSKKKSTPIMQSHISGIVRIHDAYAVKDDFECT